MLNCRSTRSRGEQGGAKGWGQGGQGRGGCEEGLHLSEEAGQRGL